MTTQMTDDIWEIAFVQYLRSLKDPSEETIECREFCFVPANCGIPLLNCVHRIQFQSGKHLDRRLVELREAQKRKGQNWSVVLFPNSTCDGVEERLSRMHLDHEPFFHTQKRMYGMRLLHERYDTHSAGEVFAQKMSKDTAFEYLTGDNSLEFARLQFEAHNVQEDSSFVEKYSTAMIQADSQVQQTSVPNVHMLLREGDKVMSVGSYQMVDETTACIFEVCTSLDERRKGYGTLILEKLLHEAILLGNARDIIAFAVDEAERFFYVNGFVKFCTIPFFSREENKKGD